MLAPTELVGPLSISASPAWKFPPINSFERAWCFRHGLGEMGIFWALRKLSVSIEKQAGKLRVATQELRSRIGSDTYKQDVVLGGHPIKYSDDYLSPFGLL